jgi:hypothetical protein
MDDKVTNFMDYDDSEDLKSEELVDIHVEEDKFAHLNHL